MPKFEKVDDHTVRIIIEKADDVDMSQILKNKEMLEEELTRIQKTIDNVNEIIAFAKEHDINITVPEKTEDK